MSQYVVASALMLTCFPVTLPGLDRFSAPSQQTTVEPWFAGKPVPKWENGLLLAYEFEPLPAKVFAFDRTGQLVTEATLSVPEASRVNLNSVAASPDGVLAVAGSAYTEDGLASAFIGWINPSGSVERIIQTSPFAAIRLCFTEDGTLWAAGREATPDFRGEAPHDVLRRYDPDGKQIQSLLPRESFARYSNYHPAILAFLVGSADRVGFYSPPANEWVEVSLDGGILGRWKGLEGGPEVKIRGAGLTPAGSVFVCSTTPDPARRGRQITEYHQLDKQTGAWVAVDGSNVLSAERPFASIAGMDGSSLVMLAGFKQLFWVPVE